MKFLIVLTLSVAMTLAQKSPYSFSSGTQIQLAQRFQTDEDREAQQNGVDLGNRFGDTSTSVPLPVDAHGDYALIKEIETWPREKQPFWYLNWKQIEAARGSPQTTTTASSQQPTGLNNQPQQSNVQPQQSNVQPQQSNVQPQQSNVQPQQSNVQPQQSTVQPQQGSSQLPQQSTEQSTQTQEPQQVGQLGTARRSPSSSNRFVRF